MGSTRKSLSWEQVQALNKSGIIDVQCHTRSHRNLTMRRGEELNAYLERLEDELIQSRELLRRKLGRYCKYLAYPYGDSNHLVAAMAEKAGYRAAFSVRRGAVPFFVNNYRVWRSMVYGTFTLERFAENLENFSDRVLK